MDQQHQPETGATQRLCSHCSAISETEGDFCPRCGGSLVRGSRRLSRRTATILASALLALLIAGGAGAVIVKHNHEVSRRHAAAAQTAAAVAKRAETAAQIADRHASEREMQASITTWARKLAVDGSLDGPILRTSCQPVGGGSENLAEITVKYDCLAVDKDNADGSSSGYAVHATMDFSTGQYQWGLGDS